MQRFFERSALVEVVLEACGGSHDWGRWLMQHGHQVRLIPPQYVKPFVKRSKNDGNDAEAICVAAAQPSIGSVPVKSAEAQANAMLLSVRELRGPITALNLALRIDPSQFKSGRHLAAWRGLVPRERSTGGKQRFGGISRAGNERVRQLLVVGATSVIRHAVPGSPKASPSRPLLRLGVDRGTHLGQRSMCRINRPDTRTLSRQIIIFFHNTPCLRRAVHTRPTSPNQQLLIELPRPLP